MFRRWENNGKAWKLKFLFSLLKYHIEYMLYLFMFFVLFCPFSLLNYLLGIIDSYNPHSFFFFFL